MFWSYILFAEKELQGIYFAENCFILIVRGRQSHLADKLAQNALAGNVYAFS